MKWSLSLSDSVRRVMARKFVLKRATWKCLFRVETASGADSRRRNHRGQLEVGVKPAAQVWLI
ncbi:hypothetical protein LZ30DRAFT_143912 [Colletotrichum cereale]|nr:hypothetical protein LZ30DRAFT_143912 [Colletotrichum cereale]